MELYFVHHCNTGMLTMVNKIERQTRSLSALSDDAFFLFSLVVTSLCASVDSLSHTSDLYYVDTDSLHLDDSPEILGFF